MMTTIDRQQLSTNQIILISVDFIHTYSHTSYSTEQNATRPIKYQPLSRHIR